MLDRFIYSIHLQHDGRHWIVVVANRLTRTVVTVGVFYFRNPAIHWAQDAIARKAWRDASELPDDYG